MSVEIIYFTFPVVLVALAAAGSYFSDLLERRAVARKVALEQAAARISADVLEASTRKAAMEAVFVSSADHFKTILDIELAHRGLTPGLPKKEELLRVKEFLFDVPFDGTNFETHLESQIRFSTGNYAPSSLTTREGKPTRNLKAAKRK